MAMLFEFLSMLCLMWTRKSPALGLGRAFESVVWFLPGLRISVRHWCYGRLLRGSGREFFGNDCRSYQRLLDQTIDEPGHGNPFRLGAKIQSGHEVTPELRRIPFRAGHG